MKESILGQIAALKEMPTRELQKKYEELFNGKRNLERLIEYLNMNCYTAVVGQMLDMFSHRPLNKMAVTGDTAISDAGGYYDIAYIEKHDYATCDKKGICNTGNTLSNPNIKFYFNGIRHYIFNTANGLSKHPMIFADNKLRIIHPHCVTGANCADINLVLFHYPFVNFFEKIQKYIKENFGPSEEYETYISKYRQNPGMTLKQATSQKFHSVNDLVANGFLVVSENYLNFVKKYKRAA